MTRGTSEQDERRREAKRMNAVFGLGGRSALSGEVDIRLGLDPVASRRIDGQSTVWLRVLGRRLAAALHRALPLPREPSAKRRRTDG